MQNPFNHENYPSNDLKRNTFPCSFQNNLTMKYGYIYPAGIWRTVPGATYKIRPTLGLNFMPTTFPVQTRQKVYVHYFYGRDRNFWKDYKDFVNGQRPDLVKPYIDESVTQARTGKLLDYLGVPTTLVGNYGTDNLISLRGDAQLVAGNFNFTLPENFDVQNIRDAILSLKSISPSAGYTYYNADGVAYTYPSIDFSAYKNTNTISYQFPTGFNSTGVPPATRVDGSNTLDYYSPLPRESYNFQNLTFICITEQPLDYTSSNTIISIIPVSKNKDNLISFDISDLDLSEYSTVYCSLLVYSRRYMYYKNVDGNVITNHVVNNPPNPTELTYSISIFVHDSTPEVRDIDDTNSPYWRTGATTDLRERIKLNAYLPRFYETVYNLYYRNPQNNPYMLDGRPEYNKFIPTKDGGLDSNLYELRRRNWEDDFLTTAVQSPQQGIAPLVGLTDRGATLTLTNDDGTVTRYNVTTTETGSITGIEANDTSAEPVLTKALIDAVSYGISIEDIRNVNAMQKWLELNLRKGYQYKDIIQARWGISISYNELDLPEFIGGFTKDVQLQAVTQTANVSDEVTGQLGWQAGRLYAQGEGREITHYCDEEGYIMCLITVVPVPNYSQLLPKHWFERDLLDSYQPEFNHIGFQPITYKEVCPVQAYQESTENVNVLEQTFGYQRPWYQYFNYTDEVHGQFRTTFKDFLINRVFDVKPELSESFLLVDPEQINDVFNVPDADDDKIIGAIYHNCVAKLPISLYAQARLE